MGNSQRVNAIDTKIDDRCRPGCLTGLVKPGERYAVERISPVEVRMTLLEPAQMARPRLVEKDGLLVFTGGRKIMQADIDKELEEFP